MALSFDKNQALLDLKENGYAIFKTEDAVPTIAYARAFGRVIAARAGGMLVDRLVPTELKDAMPNSMSARFGGGEFPFHTDGAYMPLPPQYILLRCFHDDGSQRPTKLIKFSLPSDEETMSALTGQIWLINTGKKSFLGTLLTNRNGRWFIRYDPVCMSLRKSSCQKIRTFLEHQISRPPKNIFWQKNSALLIDNWRTLHSRGNATYPAVDQRVLERCTIMEEM